VRLPPATHQDPGGQHLASQTHPLPSALHPHQLQLDQPGRTLVRLQHRRTSPPRQPHLRPSPRSRHPRLGHRLERGTQAVHLDQDRRTDPAITRPTSYTNLRRRTLAARTSGIPMGVTPAVACPRRRVKRVSTWVAARARLDIRLLGGRAGRSVMDVSPFGGAGSAGVLPSSPSRCGGPRRPLRTLSRPCVKYERGKVNRALTVSDATVYPVLRSVIDVSDRPHNTPANIGVSVPTAARAAPRQAGRSRVPARPPPVPSPRCPRRPFSRHAGYAHRPGTAAESSTSSRSDDSGPHTESEDPAGGAKPRLLRSVRGVTVEYSYRRVHRTLSPQTAAR